MKQLLFVFLLAWASLANAQTDAKAINAFKAMVASASKTTESTDVFFNDKNNVWRRSYVFISGIKYDVKKTDSAMNPLIGYVEFAALSKVSDGYQTKAEAQNSSDVMDHGMVQDFTITYKWDGKRWKADRAVYDSSVIGMSTPGRTIKGLTYKPKPKADMGALDKALAKWLPGIY